MAIVELFESSHVPVKKPLHKRRVRGSVAALLGCQGRQKHGLDFFSPSKIYGTAT
jgi:hypothetical protein